MNESNLLLVLRGNEIILFMHEYGKIHQKKMNCYLHSSIKFELTSSVVRSHRTDTPLLFCIWIMLHVYRGVHNRVHPHYMEGGTITCTSIIFLCILHDEMSRREHTNGFCLRGDGVQWFDPIFQHLKSVIKYFVNKIIHSM